MSAFEIAIAIGGLVGGSTVAFACIQYLRQQALKQPDAEEGD